MKKVLALVIVVGIVLGFAGYSYIVYKRAELVQPTVASIDEVHVFLEASSMGMEYKKSNGDSVDVKYLPGIFYQPGKRVPNLLHFEFVINEESLALKNITIYLWYSLFNVSNQTPPRGLLSLNGTVPYGALGNNRTFTIFYNYSDEHNWGSWAKYVLEPSGGMIEVSTNGSGSLWSVADINSFQRRLIEGNGDGSVDYLPDNLTGSFRYMGSVTVESVNHVIPQTLFVLLSSNGTLAEGLEERNGGVLIVPVVVFNYEGKKFQWKSWHGLPYPDAVKTKVGRVLSFVLGDNRQEVGDDGYIYLSWVIDYTFNVSIQ
ncbi:hypothetical protein A3L09_01290 [Thermococcus profundus]|uniref:Uncharacterized protein n=1 Tax=Thermococcus profundus TaxID=49899 RepID=A0A2Z2M6K8_THEPR|nr:hypothetical protein A3L09_01290 [Thermococcus profundus]